MQSEAVLVKMIEAVEAAAPESVDPTTLSIFTSPFAFARRARNLSLNDRAATIDRLTLGLAVLLDIVEYDWLARQALDVAIPEGREADLDDPERHGPALLRAMVALGLPPCRIAGRQQVAPTMDWPAPPHAA